MVFKSVYKGGLGFWNWLFNQQTPVREVTPLRDIERDQLIRKLAEERQSLQSQLGEKLAEERERKEQVKDEQVQQELIKRLNKKQEEINKKSIGKTFSFNKLFTKYNQDKKFRESVEITDKDDESIIGLFKDLVVLGNGDLALLDKKGNVVVRGKTLRQIIHKPESLNNYMRRKRIPIPFNKDMQYIPDLETIEIPEIVYNPDTDSFDEAQELIKPIKDMIIDRERELQEKSKYIEFTEARITKLQRENADLKRTSYRLKTMADASNTELSKVLEKSLEQDKRVADMHNKVVTLSQMNALKEVLITKLESVNGKMMDQLESVSDKTKFKGVQEFIQDTVDWAKKITPETVIQNVEQHPQPIQPGQKLGVQNG